MAEVNARQNVAGSGSSGLIAADHDSNTSRGGKCLLTMALAYLAVGAYVWGRWGRDGWPAGSNWWDDLALSGAGQAILSGLTPNQDFWAPFVFPMYLRALAIHWTGLNAAYVFENLANGAIVLALCCGLMWGRRQQFALYGAVMMLVVAAAFPFNLTSISEANFGYVAYAGSYNRLGGGLMGVIFLLPILLPRPLGRRQDAGRVLILSVTLALAFFVKVTAFQACVFMLLLRAALFRQEFPPRLLCITLIITTIAIAAICQWFGQWGYFDALADASSIRAETLLSRTHWLLGYLVYYDRIILALFLVLALLVVVSGVLARVSMAAPAIWFLAAVAITSVYTLVNYGDNGLMPVIGAVATLIHDHQSLAGKRRDGARIATTVKRVINLLGILSAVYYLAMAAVFLVACRHVLDLDRRDAGAGKGYLFDATDVGRALELKHAAFPMDMGDPAVYVRYVDVVADGLRYLESAGVPRSKSVYVMDFPAYMYATHGGYRVPRHSYPWMLYGHEITIDHRPDPSVIFADVDVLMFSKCTPWAGNRRWLYDIYRVDINKAFSRVANRECWDIFMKKGVLRGN